MAAPKSNQFWKNRSKHGRDILFATPAALWTAATEYFAWCDAHPWMKVEQLKKPTVLVDKKGKETLISTCELPTARPYTMQGLCLYLGCGHDYFRQFKESNKNEDFSGVISRIEEVIYTQKFEGAVVGAFNANIISRDLGLTDKVEQVQQVTVTVKRQRKERPDHNG